MLHHIEISNFYSIRERQIIDLRTAANAPEQPERLAPVWLGATERAPKVIALFGANASGKSTVLRALSFIKWFVKDSFLSSPNAFMPYERFLDEEMLGAPTHFVVHFSGPCDFTRISEMDASHCKYAYEVTIGGPRGEQQRVLNEVLKYWPSGAGRQVRLFERDENNLVTFGKDFAVKGFRQALETVLRPNASVISTLASLKHPFSNYLWMSADSLVSNILIEKTEITDEAIARYYAANPDLVDRLNQDLPRLDLGIRAMRVQQGVNGPPFTVFEHEGLISPLVSRLESNGTKLFVKIFPLIDEALKKGGVAIIDELDLAIHPMVIPEIVRWFYDPKRNQHNAQLWMTCNNASLLEDLIKEEVWFCEKNISGRTSVYSLRDVKAVRRGDNYYRKYLGGVYGAVPHVG